MLRELLKKIKELGILVKAFAVEEETLKKNNSECIVYVYKPISHNSFRLEIRIISKSLERTLEMEHTLRYHLVGVGDTVKVPKCTSITFSEGYSAKEEESKTVQLFFNIDIVGFR